MDPLMRLAPVGMDVVSKLLRSICVSAEGLVAEIQPWEGSRRKGISFPVHEVAAELQELKESMSWVYGVLLDADLLLAPDGRALAFQARDAVFGLENLVDLLEYPPTKFGTNPLPYLMCWPGVSYWKQKEFLKKLRLVTTEARTLVHLLGKGTGSSTLNPLLLLDPPGCGSGDDHIDSADSPALEVFGRDKELHKMLGMLTRTVGQPELKVIAITGSGGVGKTMLAQRAYNHTAVQQHFEVRSWVFVSTSFGRMELAAGILRSGQPACAGSVDKMLDFEMLQSELRRFVASKRCLIVLDDIWVGTDDMRAAWHDILTPLRSAGTGSRILVTTRKKTAVPQILGESHIFPLTPMGTDDLLALFKGHAFGSNGDDEHPELKPIWRAIVAQAKGLPLAIKVLGKLLSTTRSKEQQKSIMGTLIQHDAVSPALRNNNTLIYDDTILSALRLSYNHLPEQLKRCFVYCSLFPKNWTFDPAHLTRLWVAEGFVQQPVSRDEESIEDTAKAYFDQLLSRSFFQDLKIGSRIYYLVPHLLHDVAEFVADKDFFRIEQAVNRDIPSTVRHLSVTINSLHGLKSFNHFKRLRTLLVLRSNPFSSNWFEKDLPDKPRDLRVLDLSGCTLTEIPYSVGNLLHLRYLSIRGTIQKLPESIGKLVHLQYLCFSGNCSLENLPGTINMLVNLRQLLVPTKYTTGLVGIGRLINLQGSLELNVEKFAGHTIEELRNINGLRGSLKIKGLENVSSNREARKAKLNKKRYLNTLVLEWSSTHRKLRPPADTEVLEGLVPPPYLRQLRIGRYCGTKPPTWLESPSLQLLQSLHLINCRSLYILPPMGHLPSLKTLHMKELCSIVQIDHNFYGTNVVAFPSLNVLEICDFPMLREWFGIENKKSFPCLERLLLVDCSELNQIPQLPSTATEVTIERTRVVPYMRLAPFSSSSETLQLEVSTTSDLFKGLLHKVHTKSIAAINISGAEPLAAIEEASSLISLQRLQLSRCEFTDQTLSTFLQALPCLSSLEIVGLPNITTLPAWEELEFSTMVRELCVRDCQSLQSLSSLQFLHSLRYLVIERCPKLTAASFPVNIRKLSSLKVLTISNCSGIQSFPMPSSLETVHFIDCHPELSRMIKKQWWPLL